MKKGDPRLEPALVAFVATARAQPWSLWKAVSRTLFILWLVVAAIALLNVVANVVTGEHFCRRSCDRAGLRLDARDARAGLDRTESTWLIGPRSR